MREDRNLILNQVIKENICRSTPEIEDQRSIDPPEWSVIIEPLKFFIFQNEVIEI